MWSRLVARLVIWALNRTDVTVEDRNLLTAAILDKLQALPLHEIITTDVDTGEVLVNGRSLEIEEARMLRESAVQALRNRALNLVREQVVYQTFVGAAFKSADYKDFLFGRAALWWGEEIEKHLRTLAQKKEELDL